MKEIQKFHAPLSPSSACLDGLLALLTFNIAYDTGIFPSERQRVELSGREDDDFGDKAPDEKSRLLSDMVSQTDLLLAAASMEVPLGPGAFRGPRCWDTVPMRTLSTGKAPDAVRDQIMRHDPRWIQHLPQPFSRIRYPEYGLMVADPRQAD
ncbi:hypothetical protein V8E54_007217 [Elaphomyces granulatus]